MGTAAVSPSQVVQQRFVSQVTMGWQSYDVCEHHTTQAERAAFLTRALDIGSAARPQIREAKELSVRETSASPALHLGIAELEFPTVEDAARSYGREGPAGQRFFAGTKILTRYISLRRDRRLLVVYSETHLQPSVQRFLQDLQARPTSVWD
jgi:hypothetical protein